MTNGKKVRRSLLALGTLLAGGCSMNAAHTPASPVSDGTVVTGRAALASFPEAPDTVQVTDATRVVARAPLGPDGAFSLPIPAGKELRLELVGTSAAYGLVLPRGGETLDATFAVKGPRAPFHLGSLRFVGDARRMAFAVHHARPDGAAEDDCENGLDATGAACVDDEEAGRDSCGLEAETTTSVGCEDGTDVATGEPCGAAKPAPALPAMAMVADHNLPAALGCAAK